MRWTGAGFLIACAKSPTHADQLIAAPHPEPVWTLFVHGSGDDPSVFDELAPALLARAPDADVAWVRYDWREPAAKKLSAPEAGFREGTAIADVLLDAALDHVHVIAHSVGAHVAHGIEVAFAEADAPPTLHLTLLDPFVGRGLDFAWGRDRIGASADVTEVYFVIGDGVPSTEAPLTHAINVDTSATVPADDAWAGSEAHWWPIAAYPLAIPGFDLSWEVTGAPPDPTRLGAERGEVIPVATSPR